LRRDGHVVVKLDGDFAEGGVHNDGGIVGDGIGEQQALFEQLNGLD
jgi:hypothetical protein